MESSADDFLSLAPFGVCVIDLHRGLIYRNTRCSDLCHQSSLPNCEKHESCPFAKISKQSDLESDLQFEHGFDLHGQPVDLALFRHNGQEYRFIFPLSAKVAGVKDIIAAHGLTARELEIASLLVIGWPNGKICDKLGVSGNTVKTHIKSIYRKLPEEAQRLFRNR